MITHLIKKDIKLRKLFVQKELYYILLKTIIFNKNIDMFLRQRAFSLLENYLNRMYITRIKKYCILTGRSRGVYGKFRISRIKLRKFFSFGLIVNYKKSSW